ncbi:hypothetical protein FRB97_007466 [Tulasnella sp. 331]|nr:hypothetical protein FRB98_003764 [Tulasnella sp. 332]KAG8882979.1 hypothetical protein FRB97_007466 [Tulasnella sp. 331]
MVYAAALLGNLLFASAALAAPSSRLAARLERRREGRQSQPINRLVPGISQAGEVSNEQYSSNWAGAVYDGTPAGTFKSVTGTFVVPTPKAASGQTSGSASAWVGIDGDTCGNAILQTGVDFTITNGKVSYDAHDRLTTPAWYEWYPDYAYDFSGITISAGDSITTTVTATSTKAGTAVIKNNTTGKTVTKSLTSSYALCEQNAEWIVEDYEEGSSLVTMANFGTVTFTGASAGLVSGGSEGPSGASLIDIEQNSKVLTSSSISSSSVTVKARHREHSIDNDSQGFEHYPSEDKDLAFEIDLDLDAMTLQQQPRPEPEVHNEPQHPPHDAILETKTERETLAAAPVLAAYLAYKINAAIDELRLRPEAEHVGVTVRRELEIMSWCLAL